MREDKKLRQDVGHDEGDAAPRHVVAWRGELGESSALGEASGGTRYDAPGAASNAPGGASAASVAGTGRFPVEHGPDGRQVNDERGFPVEPL
eukprot:796698-Rhodomonas_salina.1